MESVLYEQAPFLLIYVKLFIILLKFFINIPYKKLVFKEYFMEIQPINESVVNRFINKLDKRTQIDNPSIFIPNTEDSGIDQDFIFKNLYQ